MSIHPHLAAALLLAAAGAAGAAEPVRIQPAVVPMLQAPAAKQGGEPAGKPAPAPRVPGPVISAHVHRADDGSVEVACSVDHGTSGAASPAGGSGAEARR